MSNKSSRTRLYINEPLDKGTAHFVDGNQGHYLVNVLRIKLGERISLFNGVDGEWLAEITKSKKGKAIITVMEKIADQTSEPDLWYLFAPVKKARVDYMIQKATELGVSYMRPVLTQHTNLTRIKEDKIVANMVEAAEQCARMTVPELDVMTSLEDVLDNFPDDRGLIFCDEAGDAIPIKDVERNHDKWAILIGPEGGFSVEERAMIRAHKNAVAVTLGPRILRADTAAVAALSLWQSYLGDW
ncbi:MAG: 16S rRNA (uracil(1498)-N(3))-methyltransferase [Emcibacteraceae bacterium]|nr:16S rRNA (uracil(1498)-N(3))-methyltransferase [Emcibacteraceae bacterium]MDG1858963.1 16S rRNA (uracil(1498)-N(3))-methyltransferase [Emcibacteraceae bacterium]